MAVSAPTAGPIAGGWITATLSWHWLFLINVLPGLLSILVASRFLPKAPPHLREARALDYLSLALMATSLTALVIALKQAPERGWTSGLVVGLLALSVTSAIGFVRRTRRATAPIVDLTAFADRRFAIGCILSFVLGIGLFGSVYLMPVFLAFVRGHNALEIGTIMLVTGVAQLLMAPVAVALEQRANARLLTAAGFGLFSLGLGMSAFQTPETDFAGMFPPQVVRGLAIMFCLLPPTRLALGHLAAERVPDASGVFNLMRNLGGAIGLALIDTVIYTRAPGHGEAIVARLQAGDISTARFVGLPLDLFKNRPPGPLDAGTIEFLRPLVEKAALVQSINDAWALVAGLTFAALLCIPFATNRRPTAVPERSQAIGP
jgi:DHA2 family multidrug resistance protein